MLSHLAHCFGTWHVYPLSSVCLDICEHGNHARIHVKTIGSRSPERGGLGLIENELWSGSVETPAQNDKFINISTATKNNNKHSNLLTFHDDVCVCVCVCEREREFVCLFPNESCLLSFQLHETVYSVYSLVTCINNFGTFRNFAV